jgi:arylsulfatase A-like enzyme
MNQSMIWLAAMAVLIFAAVGEGADTKPNLLLILADDLGYGDVHCLNPERSRIPTPHLDRLAAEGMVFTDAHSGSSVCTPTRYGLLTGRYAWRTRLQRGVLDGGNDEPLIAADRLTLGAFLKLQGYDTACIGKWHLGFQSRVSPGSDTTGKGRERAGLPLGATLIGGPTTRGFDRFFGVSNARTMASFIGNDRVVGQIEPVEVLPRLEKEALAYLEERADSPNEAKPFFLYLPLTSPHTPIVPAASWQGRSGLGDYADFVMQTDAVIGRILAALEEHGLARNTLVLVSADNGCSPAAKVTELEKQGHFPSGPYRGYKADIWEGGHRVPFLVRWPGKVKPGSRCDATVCLTDVFATWADLLGAELPETAAEDSFSLLPHFLGETAAPARGAVVHHSIAGRFAIREGAWKLALCPGSGGWGKPQDAEALREGSPSVQLYNLETDPDESTNVGPSHPEVVARLTTLLDRFVADGRSTPGARQRNDVEVRVLAPDPPKSTRKPKPLP